MLRRLWSIPKLGAPVGSKFVPVCIQEDILSLAAACAWANNAIQRAQRESYATSAKRGSVEHGAGGILVVSKSRRPLRLPACLRWQTCKGRQPKRNDAKLAAINQR